MNFQYPKTFICCLLGLMYLNIGFSQTPGVALAPPIKTLKIDGDLSDWPMNLSSYSLDFIYANEELSTGDFGASFRIAYNWSERSLYIGLEVIDEDHLIGEGENKAMDNVVLYLDPTHDPTGGSTIMFTAGEKMRDVLHRPQTFDPYNQGLDWEEVDLVVKRKGDRTVYEWKISLGEWLMPNKSIGLDFFITDVDQGQDWEDLAIWTNVFAKSQGANRLGSVIFLAEDAETGQLVGQVKIADPLLKQEARVLHIQSIENPDLWVDITTDTLGAYTATLPVGIYSIQPKYTLTSYFESGDFNQDSRKISLEKPVQFDLAAGSREVPVLLLKTEPLPQGLFEKKGILFQEEIDPYKIDRFIQAYQTYFQIPGVSVALIKEGKVVYSNRFGLKNTLTGENVTAHTVFEAASISKSVFACMVLRLEEKGIIDLDKPLHEYLPFPNLEKDVRSKLLTARIILNHQSGLPNWAWGGPGTWKNGGELELSFKPGTAFGYSGEAFNYLGRVVAHITGKSLTQLFEEEIKATFGLKNTYLRYTEDLSSKMSNGHYHTFPRYKPRELVESPASSLHTEADDFSKFVIGLMKGEYLSKESYKKIYTPYTNLRPEERLYDPNLPQGVAYGFFVQETPQGKVVGHGGNNMDFDSKYAYFPEKKVGYIAFANSNLGDEFIRMLELYVFRGQP